MYIEGEDEEAEMRPRGLRRTASGMFMPFDDDEDGADAGAAATRLALGIGAGSGGGRIQARGADTVNTARDIAHVIWNVGWRQ